MERIETRGYYYRFSISRHTITNGIEEEESLGFIQKNSISAQYRDCDLTYASRYIYIYIYIYIIIYSNKFCIRKLHACVKFVISRGSNI